LLIIDPKTDFGALVSDAYYPCFVRVTLETP
jgi:hypothetical protein